MSNMPMHDRRTGETAIIAQHMGAPGSYYSRTAHDEAKNWHENTWMSGPAHASAHRAVIWDTQGKRSEAPRAVPMDHPEHGKGVLMQHGPGMNTFHANKDIHSLNFIDQHGIDPNIPSSMERAEKWRASLPHNATEHDVYGR
jgi:hypothetical protein